MTTEEQAPQDGAPEPMDNGIEGERGISSITSAKSAGLNEKNKKFLVAAGLVFLGTMAFLQWPSDEEPAPPEETERQQTTIRPGQNFEPAELPQEQEQQAQPEKAEPEPYAPVGPIERVRREEQLAPAEPSEAEQLYESSKRAPVMAYQGNLTGLAGSAAQAGTDAGANLFGGSAEGAGGKLTGLAAELVTSDRQSEKATVLTHPNLTVTQGTTIPCSLDTAMDSTAPGMVRCTVTDDVYSTTGAVILLDRGTRIVGEYKGGMQRGRQRLFVIWTRAETPNGVIVNLGSPGADALGLTGFDGDIDTQFWTRFGGTMMLSIIDDALIVATTSGDGDDGSYENSRAAARSLAQTELENTIDVPVILRKNQGEEVSVMVARDLDFSGVYRLK
ncbi:type IV secretion system protein VirB10 (plasmid) [Thioclava sp. 'Guangxiensis']|uniref:type IV secretion system protein VirB10 n=1 Tax=Thioclava sp. 'Guangxiensis' TaxID=3149044 RepID=UPI0032C4875C